jgi:hypothetical protein
MRAHLELIGQTKKPGAHEMIQETTANYVRLVKQFVRNQKKKRLCFSQEAWTNEEKTSLEESG